MFSDAQPPRPGPGGLYHPKADLPYALSSPRDETDGSFPDLALALCRRAFLEEPVAVRAAEEPGALHAVYRVRLESGRRVVVRLSRLSPFQSDESLAIGAWAHERLADTGVPVPEVHVVDLSRRFCPFDYAIVEEARGMSLSRYDHVGDLILPLLGRLARHLARIHEEVIEGFGRLVVGPARPGTVREARGRLGSWRAHVMPRLEEHLESCERAGLVGRVDARRIDRAFVELAGLLDLTSARLLHGDLNNQNALADGSEISGIIDWDDALAGDPIHDLAVWAASQPRRRHRPVLEVYAAERGLPDDFEPRYWLYVLRVALAQGVSQQRLGHAPSSGRDTVARRIALALRSLESAVCRA